MLSPKPPRLSHTILTEMVFPNHANALGNLMGGQLLYWMDIAAAISAYRHSQRVCVTAAVDYVSFRSPIRVGELLTIEAIVTRAFNTSMEVYLRVYAQALPSNERRLCNEAYFTFVAIDQSGCPIPVPPVEPETEEEKAQYEGALRRREMRLIMAGKLDPQKASTLRFS
ncbi:MAG: acyl-CoA thioesterase [Bacteroidia bacterium]|nr:acyl-CoA thioesterase [Bacteroidia bacterium]MDW8089267.1 acyl-CoA thioesterase [Bacteroidia bacterium]